jgi:hypothetical protein
MSKAIHYLQILTEQEKKKRGPSRGAEGTDDELGMFGPQKTTDIPTKSFGDQFDLPVLDVDTLSEFINLKSGKGPGTLNHSVVVYGKPGIGKSAIIKNTARQIAKEVGREFVDFNRVYSAGPDELLKVFKTPEKYYCFIDIRAGAYEAFEFKGIPKASEKIEGTAESLDLLWIKILTIDNSAGMLFLDEINQASPETQNVLYGLLHFGERVLAEKGIRNADYWSVHAAGNLGSQYSGTSELNKALVNRASIVYFEVTFDKWLNFANTFTEDVNGKPRQVYHPLILKFLKYIQGSQPSNLDKFFADENPSNTRSGDPNPRNFEKLSMSIYALQDQYLKKKQSGEKTDDFLNRVSVLAAADINRPWASEFMNYVEVYQRANVEQMLNAPERYLTAHDKDTSPQGVPIKEFFTNLSILKDRIEGFLPEYLTALGYGDHMTGKRNFDQEQQAGTLPQPPDDTDVDAYNEELMKFFNVIETLRKANQHQNAAIVWSYIRDAKYKSTILFDLLKGVFSASLSPADGKKLNTFLKTTAQELDGKVKSALAGLAKIGGSKGTASYMQADASEDAEDEVDYDLTNSILKAVIADTGNI